MLRQDGTIWRDKAENFKSAVLAEPPLPVEAALYSEETISPSEKPFCLIWSICLEKGYLFADLTHPLLIASRLKMRS